MEDYHFLFQIAVILLVTKVLSIITKRIALPQVVGALAAGLLMGPAVLGILHETNLTNQISELGVIVLMFTAGLGTDITELRRSGKAAFIIALIGVIVPFGGGFLLASIFNKGSENLLQNLFIGVILTATSVSITVETLKEIGKLSTRSGNAILGAAIIDDVLGILALTLITSMSGEGGEKFYIVLIKIFAFFAISVVIGTLLHKLVDKWFSKYQRDKRRFVVIAFAFCLLYSYIAVVGFGVADITGAYIAGLIFAKTPKITFLQNKFDTLSYMLLSPVFFAGIGLKVEIPSMSGGIILFSILLIIVAASTKVIGCGLGAKLCHYSNTESLRIGVGMITRGEVALVVANNGIASGVMKTEFFGPVIVMVISTAILTPILLKAVYRGKEADYSELVESQLLNKHLDTEYFDIASQRLLDDHDNISSTNELQHKKNHD
ncbi:MAG: cation:proton antiporter [Oscillospiraceae bacterium]